MAIYRTEQAGGVEKVLHDDGRCVGLLYRIDAAEQPERWVADLGAAGSSPAHPSRDAALQHIVLYAEAHPDHAHQ